MHLTEFLCFMNLVWIVAGEEIQYEYLKVNGISLETLHNLTLSVAQADSKFQCAVQCSNNVVCEAFVYSEGACRFLFQPSLPESQNTESGVEYFLKAGSSHVPTCSGTTGKNSVYSCNMSSLWMQSYSPISQIRGFARLSNGKLSGLEVVFGAGEVGVLGETRPIAAKLTNTCDLLPGEFVHRVDVSLGVVTGWDIVFMVRFFTSQQTCTFGELYHPVTTVQGNRLLYLAGMYNGHIDGISVYFDRC